MQEMQLYEYAVVRIVPRIDREEFINVGLIMMCKRSKWLKVQLCPDPQRISAIARGVDTTPMIKQLDIFTQVAGGAGAFRDMPVEERFRWLTAVKSTCIQTSRPHPGITPDLEATFARLLDELVK
jgi:hypothetical protein